MRLRIKFDVRAINQCLPPSTDTEYAAAAASVPTVSSTWAMIQQS